MVKTIDTLVILLISAAMLLADHHFGSRFVCHVCKVVSDCSRHYVSDAFILWTAGGLLLFVSGIYIYLKRLDNKYVTLTCTPQLTVAEYDYLAKKTTVEKLNELKKMPQYQEVLRNATLRESQSPRYVATSQHEIRSSNRMSNGQIQETGERTVYSRRSVPGL